MKPFKKNHSERTGTCHLVAVSARTVLPGDATGQDNASGPALGDDAETKSSPRGRCSPTIYVRRPAVGEIEDQASERSRLRAGGADRLGVKKKSAPVQEAAADVRRACARGGERTSTRLVRLDALTDQQAGGPQLFAKQFSAARRGRGETRSEFHQYGKGAGLHLPQQSLGVFFITFEAGAAKERLAGPARHL